MLRRTMPIAVLSLLGALVTGTGSAVTHTGSTPSTTRAAAVTTPANTDAVTFQEDAARDGYAGAANLPSTLQLGWTKQLAGRVSYAIIAGGRVFVTVSRVPSPTTTTTTAVYAFDGATGARLWGPYVPPDPNADFASLAYDAGRLFVVSDDGYVAALQPTTGAQIWSRTLGFADLAEWDAPIASAGHLYEVSRTGGVVVWSINETNGVLDMINGVDNGPGGFALDSAGFYLDQGNGVSALTTGGVQRWRQQDDYQDFGNGTPVLHAGQMWIRSQPVQHILQASTGTQVGTFVGDRPPAFAGSTVVLMKGSTVSAANATSPAALAPIWTQNGDGGLDTDPVIAGSVVYVGSSSGSVFGYSLTTGKQVWQGKAPGPVVGTDVVASPASVLQNPTIGDGLLAVPTGDTLTVFGAAAAPIPPPGWTTTPLPPIVGVPPTKVTYPDDVSYQEDPSHDGYAGPALPGSLHAVWTHTFTGAAGSPVIVGGRMFVPVPGEDALDVYAYSAATGARLWGPVAVSDTTDTFSEPQQGGGITYDGGRLFVMSGSGEMEALAPTTGAVLWSTFIEGTQPSLPDWAAAPVAADGVVYDVGEYNVVSVNELTGRQLTAVTIRSAWSIPAANSRGVFVNLPGNTAELLTSSGKVVWQNYYGSGGLGGPAAVLHGSQAWMRPAYLGGDGQVVDQATGKVARAFTSDTPPAFEGNYAVLSEFGTLAGTNATTGATLWSEAGDTFLDSPPVIAGTTAYVASRQGMVYGYSVATGVQTWQAQLANPAGFTDTTYIDTDFNTALAIGDGYLAVPNGNSLTVFGR